MTQIPAPLDDCPRCGGALVEGRVGLAALANLRFVVRIGTTEVGTDVRATMCEECGHLDLVAKDPASITRAARARRLARPGPLSGGLLRGLGGRRDPPAS